MLSSLKRMNFREIIGGLVLRLLARWENADRNDMLGVYFVLKPILQEVYSAVVAILLKPIRDLPKHT